MRQVELFLHLEDAVDSCTLCHGPVCEVLDVV
jgi:hypothetical protein